MRIAILGGGMVGLCYAQAFIDEGHTVGGLCDLRPSEALERFTAKNNIPLYQDPGQWMNSSDVVVSAVFGSGALDIFEKSIQFLEPQTVYVDMTTALPEMMVRANEIALQKRIEFVDVAITGAVNLGMRRTPLLIAGKKAQMVHDLYLPFGGCLTVVGDEPGNAAKLKLLRSIFTKGMEALSVECLGTAAQMGLTEELFDVLKDIDATPLRKLMESMVYTHVEHSGRRAHEVHEASDQMRSVKLEPVVLKGVQSLFEKTAAAYQAKGFDGATSADATQWLNSNVLGNKSA